MGTVKSSAAQQTKTENLVYDPKKMSFDDFFRMNAVMFIPYIDQKTMAMGGLRMDLLPEEAKQIFVRWLFEVNRRRLEAGQPLLVTYDIVRQCPLWKIIPMPYRNYKLTKENLQKLRQLVPQSEKHTFQAIK